jgi:DMSO reductase anchor subunit
VTQQQIIAPSQEKTWGWSKVLHFILGGAGAGFYLLSLSTAILQEGVAALHKPVPFAVLAPLLIGLGFFVLVIQADRPIRARYLLRNVRHSWISRETMAWVVFVTSLILDRLFPHLLLRILTLASALGLMIGQGFIVYQARAVRAWNVRIMPLFFLSSGLTSGYGVFMLVFASHRLSLGYDRAVLGVICVVSNLAVWILYLRWSPVSTFKSATKNLRRPIKLVVTVGLGHAVPLLILLLFITGQDAKTGGELPHIVTALIGSAMVTGVFYQKSGVIIEAGYTRGISFNDPGLKPANNKKAEPKLRSVL